MSETTQESGCRALLVDETLCGAPIYKTLTTSHGYTLHYCRRHWLWSEAGAPVEVVGVKTEESAAGGADRGADGGE